MVGLLPGVEHSDDDGDGRLLGRGGGVGDRRKALRGDEDGGRVGSGRWRRAPTQRRSAMKGAEVVVARRCRERL